MRVRQYGWDGLLLEVDDPAGWFRLLSDARERGELVCEELVPGAATVLLRGVTRRPDWSGWTVRTRAAAPAGQVEIPVHWDGPDLDDVARRWDGDPARVLRGVEFTVAFCGFAPGFGYLTGLPEPLRLPRLDSPRTRVPAGSVALAGPYAGVYPRSSPGGWRLVGHTRLTLFDPDRQPPALLAPGMTVRFVDA
ncbi:allophanate hydrolase [Catellatospora sp. TT07R-123]|uniref:5-oxoprolinase subunit B family protein n=1 Tax=Catellatospora sp. TT07R-123 TaxID=2733863 RepID=UPI001B2AB291|nr:allophanate hydrolase subunit 1 [Catellatospora sp. TT07R-123]GHJ46571.1 allophanate hydrolase [Catellatospora sp. TT07R-123]